MCLIFRISTRLLGVLLVSLLMWMAGAGSALHAAPAVDSDGDGLSDTVELGLGTNAASVDTDCDTYDDMTEVGDAVHPIDTDGDGLIDARENNWSRYQTTATPVVQVVCFRFTPFVIADDNSDKARVEVRVESPIDVGGVSLPIDFMSSYITGLRLDGAPVTYDMEIELFDDGTHGDRQSGDKVWSRDGFTAGEQTPPLGERDLTVRYLGIVRVLDRQGDTLLEKQYSTGVAGAELGLVSRHVLQAPQAPADNVQIVGHTAAIVDPLASLLVGRLPSGWGLAARTVYQYFQDRFDFLVLYQSPDPSNEQYGSLAGVYQSVRNNVSGIGQALHNSTSAYGSDGKLQGVIWIDFGAGGPFGHELMHRWAAPLLPVLGMNQCTATPPDQHWGVAGVGRGMLGGYDPTTLVNNGDGTFTVSDFAPSANWVPSYNQLELYLAGMIPASQVQPIQIPVGVVCASLVRDFDAGTVRFRATGFLTKTVADIQQALGGARNPPFEQAQKSFTVGSFVITDRPLTEAELAFFNVRSESISRDNAPGSYRYSFSQLTQGAGTVTTTLDVSSIKGIDIWVGVSEPVIGRAGQPVDILVQVGNISARASGPVTLTLTLDSALTYVADTFGVTPTVASEGDTTTVRWQWPTLGATAINEGIVTVTVPDASSPGATYDFIITVDAAADPQPVNNAGRGQVVVSTFVYLPGIQR